MLGIYTFLCMDVLSHLYIRLSVYVSTYLSLCYSFNFIQGVKKNPYTNLEGL